MNTERHQRIREVFAAVCDLPPEEQPAYLDKACAGDPELRARVELLLAHDADETELLDERALEAGFQLRPGDGPADGPPPDSFAGYEIVREIHRGAQGVVYLAIQQAPRRKVAIKVMREGPFAGPREKARFEREAQILGELNHPNIVAIHESGTADGTFYFVMDYISGEALDQYVATRSRAGKAPQAGGLSVDETLKLFVKICDAVNEAHLHGIIHRDLKPGNIRIDAHDQPHILDFGLAKVGTQEVTADARPQVMTLTGQFLGSLPWASPEQASGAPELIDIRTDVYSLGVILYQMLTGRFPYEVVGNMRDVLDNILRSEPARPSTVRRQINDEVETIVLKALSKERDRRYQTAGELARDIKHYLAGEPIEAKRDSGWYVIRKNLKRYRVHTAVAAGFIVLIMGFGVWMSILYARAEDLRQVAEAAELEAKQDRDRLQVVTKFQQSMLGETDAAQMGRGILDRLRDEIRKTLEVRNRPPEETDEAIASFDSALKGTNVTNVALTVIDEHVLSRGAKTIEEEFASQPLVRAALQQTVANTYRDIGLFAPALALQETALGTRREELGDTHPDTLISISNTGYLLERIGKYDESEAYLREALEGFRRILGDEHPDTLNTIHNMARLLTAMGELAEAEPYWHEAVEGQRRVLGNEHPDTLNSINNMGVLLQSAGRLAEAEPYYREALEGYRRVLGDDHQDTLSAINNMGALLQSMGKPAEGEPYYREALERYRRVLGDDHPDTLASINNMGYLLESMGRPAEAEPYHRKAIEGRRRVLGDDHPNTLTSISNMGALLASLGRLAEAEPYYREALERKRRVLGDGHSETLTSINNMGVLLKTMGKPAEAEPYFREALEGKRRLLGDEHSDTLTAVNNMGVLLNSMGKVAEAEPYYREALEGCRRVLGGDHPDTLGSINNMGALLQAMNRPGEAESFYREALEGRRRVLGNDHPNTLTSVNNLGSLLQSMGKLAEAEPYGREAVEGLRRAVGNDHTNTLIAIHNLGRLLRDLGRLEEAEALGAEAVRGARARLAPSHTFRLAAVAQHGRTLAAMQRFTEAEVELLEACDGFVETRGPDYERTIKTIGFLVDLYTAWHETEPGNGHDAKAAEYRAMLPQPPEPGEQPPP